MVSRTVQGVVDWEDANCRARSMPGLLVTIHDRREKPGDPEGTDDMMYHVAVYHYHRVRGSHARAPPRSDRLVGLQ